MHRLLLFDIDGTLLSTNGAAKRAFHRALLEVYGSAGPIATHRFDGKTDPQIARELLEAAGFARSVIDRGMAALWKCYLRELAAELARPGHITTVLPGVRPLLAALGRRNGLALQGLLTGNIEPGAALKLRSVGLGTHFRTGAYGSDHERRDRLPAIAIERAAALTGRTYAGRNVTILGDTPSDVTCGAALGVRAVGVATGRYGADALRDAGADVVLDDLADTTAALDALLGD